MRKYLFFLVPLLLSSLFANQNFSSFTGKITGNKVHIRCSPNLEGAIVAKINKKDLLLIVGEKEDYYAISPPENTKVYVFKAYITDDTVQADRVNIRLHPNLEAPVLGQLSKNQKVEGNICTTANQWLEITPPENICFYVSKEYVTRAGDANYFHLMQQRKTEVNKLLNSAFFLAQAECKKPYQQMHPEEAISQFEAIIKGYQDFEEHAKQAKEGLALLKDTYLQKKIAHLETKANLPPSEKEKILKNVSSFERKDPPAPSFEKKAHSLAVNMTEKMQQWIPLEKELFATWRTYHPDKVIEDFYNDQKLNAISLTGIIEKYEDPVRNKPGNYLLKGDMIPQAYLYSTLINLEKHLGKKVTILVSPRPNNNFAFPAYFVNSIK